MERLLSTTVIPDYAMCLQVFEGLGDTVSFRLTKDGSVLFQKENELRPGLLVYPDSFSCALSCLGFLSLQPGDTDPDFFAAYTPAQMQWARSYKCELLKGLVSDAGDPESEYHAEALRQITITYH